MDLVDNSNKNKKVKVEDTAVGTQLDTNQLDPEDTAQDAVFQDIDAEHMPTEIESLCMRCHENGTTTLLLTNIPHFKQVVLMAFECPHCLYKNNQVQSCAAVGDMGVRQTLKITTSADLSRQVVKSESCTARFVELDFEIPADTQSGILSTVFLDNLGRGTR